MSTLRQTKISSLQPNRRGLVVEFRLVKIEAVRTVRSRSDGSTHRVADLLIGDETGSIILSLWDEAIDQVEEGKVFRLMGGRTTLFQGRLQLGISPKGTLQLSTAAIPEVNTGNNLSKARHAPSKDRKSQGRTPSDPRSQGRRTRGFAWSRIKRDSDE